MSTAVAKRVVVQPRAHVALVVAGTFTVGCFSTTGVPARRDNALYPDRSEGFVLRDADGSAVKIDPNSKIAFHRTGGTITEFFAASDLLVNEEGIFLRDPRGGDRAAADGLRWSDIQSIEVKNHEAGETLVAVVAISAAVVGLVIIASASKGGGGSGFPRILPVPSPGGGTNFGGSGGSGAGGSGGTVGGNIDPPSTSDGKDERGMKGELASAGNEHPLFTDMAIRRAVVQPFFALDAASDFAANGQRQSTLGGGFRFYDFIEIGGGIRWLDPKFGPESHGNVLGFLRFGFHAELDARRRFALVLGVAYGQGGEVEGHLKVDWGLRVRVTDTWWFGAFLLNPTWTRYAKDTHPLVRDPWSFPSGLETSISF